MTKDNGVVSDDERVVRDAADAAASAVKEMAAPPPDHVKLSNGITLKLKPVPGLLIRRATTQVLRPTVPQWANPDRDGRMEPNPNDPDYLDAMERFEEAQGLAALNVMFIVGTKIEQPIPEGAEGPDSDEWIESLKFFEIEAKTEGPGRYLDWLKYIALATIDDLANVSAALGRMSGLQEQDVAALLNSFRGGEVRGTNSGTDPENTGDGDRVRAAAAGDSDGDRGA